MKTFNIPDNQTSFATKEVIAITGMTKDALRYYEHLDILGPIKRDKNNYRQYSKQNLERLQFVQIFRILGLDLSLLTKSELEISSSQKATELREYRETVRQEKVRMDEIEEFLTNKINYFDKLKKV
ncbi:MerR family transcriptional regulator [Companilactobacillus nuruki]|uniref:MerR family transcriptional regulator n=1 Tax=Companilactobacillus nuruki TaxID=1993540 RepID=A0A2N7AVU7_9LACO|nr:MerR family transcriptional regulator [Companilactobacillus nuruki]PMD72300.1 MerR family transcriptional regulator [Companilactobacillus nuruki]